MRNQNDCQICEKKTCFLLQHCSEAWHDELMRSKSCIIYGKNQQIVKEGDLVTGVYFIQTGKVKIYKETTYRSQIVRLAKGGDILGFRSVKGKERYPISASTFGETLVCYIDQDLLLQLMTNNAILSLRMLQFYADELNKTETRLRNMAIMTVRERIADALLMIHESFYSDGETTLPIDFSRKDIAEIAGTYPEQVSRYVTEFKYEKLVDLVGKEIVIVQPDKLKEIVGRYDEKV